MTTVATVSSLFASDCGYTPRSSTLGARVIAVTGLNTYPIKSCAGVRLTEARITPRGLQHDRDYMIVDDDGSFLSQRQIPEMALIVPTIGASAIALAAPGMPPVEVPLHLEPDAGPLVDATVHGKPVVGQIVDEHLNEWFTRSRRATARTAVSVAARR